MQDTSCDEPMDVDSSMNSGRDSTSYKRQKTNNKTNKRQKNTHKRQNSTDKSMDQGIIKDVLSNTASSNPEADITVEPVTKVEWNVKRYHINYESVSKKSYKFVTSLLVALTAIGLLGMYSFQCCDHLNPVLVSEYLNRKIYGQEEAIRIIAEALSSKEKIKVLVFYGSTGVGKTYTSSLILKNFVNCTNTYHFTMQSFQHTFSNSFFLGQYLCNTMLIVVDDLTEDLDIQNQLNDLIEKSEHLGKSITVILIYSCSPVDGSFSKTCDGTLLNTLKNYLKYVKAYKEYVRFKTLNEEHLRSCVLDVLDQNNFSESQLQDILKNFNVKIDGCKNVYSKIKFLSLK